MTLAIMPPNEPFFRHDADDFAADQAEDKQKGTKADAQQKLAKYDRAAMKRIEASGDRPKFDLVHKHLLNDGNVLLDLRKDTTRVIPLGSYAALRDPRGKLIELIIEEDIHPDALDDKIKTSLKEDVNGDASKPPADKETLQLYTHVQLIKGFYHGFQELNGVRISGTDFKKKPEDLGLIPLRFIVVDGESYGRSFVEGVYADLDSLEVLRQAITDAASMASKIVFMVRPNGSTRVKHLQDADNGDFITGEKADVTVLSLDKYADMKIAKETGNRNRRGLERAVSSSEGLLPGMPSG